MDYQSLLKNENPDAQKSYRSAGSEDETNYIDTSYLNTTESVLETLPKDPLLEKIKDNSWKKYFLIKWLILKNFMYRMTPVTYFILISYLGSNLGTKIFKSHIKKILEKTVN
jgi:hypothetical protein